MITYAIQFIAWKNKYTTTIFSSPNKLLVHFLTKRLFTPDATPYRSNTRTYQNTAQHEASPVMCICVHVYAHTHIHSFNEKFCIKLHFDNNHTTGGTPGQFLIKYSINSHHDKCGSIWPTASSSIIQYDSIQEIFH